MPDPVPIPVPTWQRDIAGPGLHALVIGVAAYPFAKPGKGYESSLRQVEDVPCTVAAAQRIADWLFDNKDILTPPLASIDMLLSDAPPDPDRTPYPMRLQPQAAIEAATTATVTQHGRAWTDRFRAGDTAFFFISGHGAMKDNDAVVFLSDLNGDRVLPWGAYVNVSDAARALKGDKRLQAAFFFADACQEYAARFNVVKTGDGALFVAQDPERLGDARDKVAFIGAASQGLTTLEGAWPSLGLNTLDGKWNDPKWTVKMGRFTQVLVEALEGASSRLLDDVWGVHAEGIASDLKSLYRLNDWTELFEPSLLLSQNERYPIVIHSEPKVPVVVLTKPADRLSGCLLEIYMPADRSKAAVEQCARGPRASWQVRLTASDWTHLVVANHSSGVEACATITPNQPIFGRTVAFV